MSKIAKALFFGTLAFSHLILAADDAKKAKLDAPEQLSHKNLVEILQAPYVDAKGERLYKIVDGMIEIKNGGPVQISTDKVPDKVEITVTDHNDEQIPYIASHKLTTPDAISSLLGKNTSAVAMLDGIGEKRVVNTYGQKFDSVLGNYHIYTLNPLNRLTTATIPITFYQEK